MPFEVTGNDTLAAVTPASGKGALGVGGLWKRGHALAQNGGYRVLDCRQSLVTNRMDWVNSRANAFSFLPLAEGRQGKPAPRTGLGKTDCPGSLGGLGKRDHGGIVNPACVQPKGRCWKPSTYSARAPVLSRHRKCLRTKIFRPCRGSFNATFYPGACAPGYYLSAPIGAPPAQFATECRDRNRSGPGSEVSCISCF